MNQVEQVVEIINKYHPHKDAYQSAQQWVIECTTHDLPTLLDHYGRQNTMVRVMCYEIIAVLKPEWKSPLYQAMNEEE